MTRKLGALLIGLLMTGCVSHQSGLGRGPVQPNPEPKLARDVIVRMRELSTMLDQYRADVRALPGRDDSEHQRVAAKLFADMGEILPTIYGPNPGGAFRQQLQIVDSTRAQLENGSPKLSYEPTEDTGLRAVYHALDALQREQFYDRQEIGKVLADVRGKLDELDTVRGPTHRGDATSVFRGYLNALEQMAGVLSARLDHRSA